MTRKIVVITGASDGIGAAAARQLSAKGHRLLLAGRSREKTENVARQTGAEYFVADFTRLANVRALADEITRAVGDQGITVLANNAGGIFGDRTPTVDGYERTFQVNHLAPFLLTYLLMPQLRLGQAAIINTSSVANRMFGNIDIADLNNTRHFSANKAYGDSKLENILFTKELHKRYHAEGVTSVAFHPGNVRTNFAADSSSLMRFVYHTPIKNLALISAERGGANLEWFIEGTPNVTWQSGGYYDERQLTDNVNPQANDPNLADALWRRSVEMVGIAARA